MNTFSNSTDRLMSITLAIGQYPILADRIRMRMRQQLFQRGIIDKKAFETDIREKAIQSQLREGLVNPVGEEPTEIWEMRQARVRDQLTDLHFSQHLSFDLFQKIITEELGEHGVSTGDPNLTFNPELAPQELIFEHAWTILRLPEAERARYEHHLEESRVVLIRTMISDQLRYINIAKRWFTIPDLAEIRTRKIGAGRIGGKAAGMLLAHRVLSQSLPEEARCCLNKPEYYFIGSNEQYSYMTMNNLERWNDQKYKTADEMRADYPAVLADFQAGTFPTDIIERLQEMLEAVGDKPLIVRSSSLLEDSFGTSFAGKYDSIFLVNQGSLRKRLKALTNAIASVYASTLNPEALLYRRSKGLLDYDERMAILIMVVEGEKHGQYYYPDAAGVAFSRNLFRWAPQIRREDGFVRLVWGLGTRAVDRVTNDYPRLVALSHPLLRPSPDFRTIQRCSQQYIDLLDLEDNTFKTLPVEQVLNADEPTLRDFAQLAEEGYFAPIQSRPTEDEMKRVTLTFEQLLRSTPFASRLRDMLQMLELHFASPVDMEFTMAVERESGDPELRFTILQCRPQARLAESAEITAPGHLPDRDVIFSTRFVVPQGAIEKVEYVAFIPPAEFFAMPVNERFGLANAIGKLNKALEGKPFIFVGPGRWGSSNADLGVPVGYSDIFNTRALVELAGKGVGPEPEPSLGTHFFQDLLEAQIFPLAVFLDDPQSVFQSAFFYHAPNCLADFITADETLKTRLRLVRVADFRKNHHLRVVMNEERGWAVGYLRADVAAQNE